MIISCYVMSHDHMQSYVVSRDCYNGCLDLTCFPGVNCTDARAPAIGASCGPCPAEYYTVNNKCQGDVMI